MRLNVATWTDNRSPKFVNQDSIFTFIRPPELGQIRALLIVADGMGSNGDNRYAGTITSQLAIKIIHHRLRDFLGQSDDSEPTSILTDMGLTESDPEKHLEWCLQSSIQEANEAIYSHWQQYKIDTNPVTTITCALIYNQLVLIANVGDCRGYHLKDDDLQQITEDHTLVNRLIQSGKISPEQAINHPQRNVIWNALGTQDEVHQVDIYKCSLGIGDQLLLCSNGLYETLDDTVLKDHMLNTDSLELTARGLVNAAKEKSTDDVSVIIAKVGADTL